MMSLSHMIVGLKKFYLKVPVQGGKLFFLVHPFLFCIVFCLPPIKSGSRVRGQDGTQRSTSGRVPRLRTKRHGVAHENGIPCGVFCCGKPAQRTAKERPLPFAFRERLDKHFSLVMCAKIVASFFVFEKVL